MGAGGGELKKKFRLSMYVIAARRGVPFGAACTYNLKSDGSYLRMGSSEGDGPQEVASNSMDSMESIAVQYLALIVFKEADFVASDFHSSIGQVSFGGNWRQRADFFCSLPKTTSRPRRLMAVNVNGLVFHNNGFHWQNCIKYSSQQIDHKGAKCSRQQDELKKLYAAALEAVDADSLQVRYLTVNECDLMHGKGVPDARIWNEELSQEEATRFSHHKTIRKCLAKEFPQESVLGVGKKHFYANQAELVRSSTSGGYNHTGECLVGGFFVIEGGAEGAVETDFHSSAFGFCHQRTSLSKETLGEFTALQAHQLAVEKMEKDNRYIGLGHGQLRDPIQVANIKAKLVSQQTDKVQTCTRNSFKGVECISRDYLKWLMEFRKFHNFKILHYIRYAHRHYLTDFFNDSLQRRHELRNEPEAELARSSLKLINNGWFGYSALESNKFHKSTILLESTLSRKPNRKKLQSSLVTRVTLLGVLIPQDEDEEEEEEDRGPRPKKAKTQKKKPNWPELVYSVTTKQPNARIFNQIQVAAAILQDSRVLLFSKIHLILTVFEPSLLEICYIGKFCILNLRKKDQVEL